MPIYFINFPKTWDLPPRLFGHWDEIEKIVKRRVIRSLGDIAPADLDRYRDRAADDLYAATLEGFSAETDPRFRSPPDKERFIITHQAEIEEKAKALYIDKQVEKLLERLSPLTRTFLPEKADPDEIQELLQLGQTHGMPDDLAQEILNFTDDNKRTDADFWKTAKVANTIPRGLPGTLKLSRQYPDMIRLRYYKGKGGTIRKTVEIEID